MLLHIDIYIPMDTNTSGINTKSISCDTKSINNDKHDEPDVLKFARTMHVQGVIPKEQVDAVDDYVKGKIDYGMMRSMCG